MSETVKDIIDTISSCCKTQGERVVYSRDVLTKEQYSEFPHSALFYAHEEVTLSQLRDRLVKAYSYERDEPAKRLLELIVREFDAGHFAAMVNLFRQASEFLAHTSKEFKPANESEVSKNE